MKKAILDELTRVGKEARLKGFELIKGVYVENEPFRWVGNPFCTVSFCFLLTMYHSFLLLGGVEAAPGFRFRNHEGSAWGERALQMQSFAFEVHRMAC